MLKTLIAAMSLFTAALAQTSVPPVAPVNATISGVVREARTGAPMLGVGISVEVGSRSFSATTDSQGRYTLRDVPPGRHMLYASIGLPTGSTSGRVFKAVTVFSGLDLASVDIRLQTFGSVSGTVRDDGGEPVPGMSIFLVTREYSLGALRYFLKKSVVTDDKGGYSLNLMEPERSYLILAKSRSEKLNANSDAPDDAKLRRPVLIPTYYPSSQTADGAEAIVLNSGERRTSVDIRVARSASYCIEGVLASGGNPAATFVRVYERQPSPGTRNGMYFTPSEAQSGPGGTLRICDLHPGEYELLAYQRTADQARLASFGLTAFTITDRDVKGMQAGLLPRVPFSGEVVWDGPPPDKTDGRVLRVLVYPISRNSLAIEGQLIATCSIPCQFSSGLPLDSYEVVTSVTLPGGMYIKDITYAGSSVLHAPLRVGSASGEAKLKIILAQDGGFVRAKVTGKGGTPVSDANVFLMPAGTYSDPELAATAISGGTDQDGIYLSRALAPGKYLALASTADVNPSPESIAKLRNARSRAKEVEVGPNATAEVTLELQSLDR